MAKLAIFGATGKTGKHLVRQALEAGHEVTALARDPGKLGITGHHLKVVQGDALDPGAVERTVEGSDAVLNALGHVKGSPADLQVKFVGALLPAMNKHGVKRLVSLTGAGVADPKDQPKLVNNLIVFLLKRLNPAVLADGERHAELIRRSNLEWVLVRGPMLTEAPRKGRYRVGSVGVNTGTRISRADLADFMLKQVTDNSYVRTAPMVSD